MIAHSIFCILTAVSAYRYLTFTAYLHYWQLFCHVPLNGTAEWTFSMIGIKFFKVLQKDKKLSELSDRAASNRDKLPIL
jgi:hypothetical protein